MATKPNQEKDAPPPPLLAGADAKAGFEPARREETGVQRALRDWASAKVEHALMNSLRIRLKELEGLMEQLRRSRL